MIWKSQLLNDWLELGTFAETHSSADDACQAPIPL